MSQSSPLLRSAPSLTEQVYDVLAGMLLDSTLKPDGKTSIRELAEQMGVSTMPVREAVGRLVAQGALAIRKNRAVEVPRMTRENFQELTDTRLLLECHAARLAATRMTAEELLETTAISAAFEAAMGSASRSDVLILNRKLHFAIYTAARSPSLLQMIAMAWLRVGPLISLDLTPAANVGRQTKSVMAHGQLMQALQARDGEAAAQAIHLDITGAAQTILDQKEYFQS